MRFEIQHALKPNSGIRVIPVLLGDDVPFSSELLPRSLRQLAKIEAAQIRRKLFDEDVARLIGRLEAIEGEQPGPSPEAAAPVRPGPVFSVAPIRPDKTGLAAQCELVLQQMVDEGNLVVFLGSRLTAEPYQETCPS